MAYLTGRDVSVYLDTLGQVEEIASVRAEVRERSQTRLPAHTPAILGG
jgi:hypothetical protein